MTANIRVGRHFEIPHVDYTQPPLFAWRQFYDFRNHTVRVLRKFGSTGPMGEVDLSSEDEEPNFDSEVIDDPDFYVINDMYNEHDKISLAGCKPALITEELIGAVSEMASAFPEWGVNFDLDDSGFRVSAGTLLWSGRRFWDCETVEQIVERCQRPVEFGPPGPFAESMYPLWAAVISGEYSSPFPHAEPLERQWFEAIQNLEYLASSYADRQLKWTHYRAIQRDLHPDTRRQLAARFLVEMAAFSAERLKAAKRNVVEDAVEALLNTTNPEEANELLASISQGQQAAAGKIDDRETVLWWSEILYRVREPNSRVTLAIEAELRRLLNNLNPLVQLSAVFGLARLRVGDITSIVDHAMRANENWLVNPELTTWLLKLRSGSSDYPVKSLFK